MERRQGSVLILVTIVTFLVGAFVAALYSTTFAYMESSKVRLNNEMAYQAAESGAGYYLVKFAADSDYFTSNPAPHASMAVGNGAFELQSATPTGMANHWQIVIRGTADGTSFRQNVVLGHKRIRIPDGVVMVGTGDPSDVALSLASGSKVGSYDPADGAYNPSAPGNNGNAAVNGSVTMTGTSIVYGDVNAEGTSTEDLSSDITGTLTENTAPTEIDDIDPIVNNAMTASKTSNNNAVLGGIFGSQWTAVASSQNYGNLIVSTPGTYVIPSGVYRFRRFEVKTGVTVIFDTAGGPSKLAYVGSGSGTGTGNDLIVNGGNVKIDPQGTGNGLLTVLGVDCDFAVSNNSIFGQAVGDTNNGGYSQIISLGGNTSSDDITISTGSKVYGRIYAAAHKFTMSGSSYLYGSVLTRTASITASTIAIDEGSLGNGLVDPSNYQILARWPAGA